MNKIYLNNYSQFATNNRDSLNNGLGINIVLVLCLLLFVLGILILSQDIANIEYFLMANILVIISILTGLGIRAFSDKPNQNNQLEQTKCDIKSYFSKINSENMKQGLPFEWICPDSFMYLEVHFK